MGKRKSKKGRSVKRNALANAGEPEELVRAPHSFVIHRGTVGKHVLSLTKDFRKLMEPFTASSLKVRKKNTVKDFVSVAGVMHVSHLVVFTLTDRGPYMRIARLPRGPTLTFRIHDYTLSRDVLSSLKKQLPFNRHFQHSPLVVLNSFQGEGIHMQLMASMFQHMFPTINLSKVNLNSVKRCLLLNYNAASKLIDVRHYAIRVTPVGLSRGVKKIVQSRVPDLSRYNDISEYLIKAENLSESEAEDDPNSHVILPQRISSRGNMAASQSAIRLSELGPRLTLQLIKVEGGLMEGEVMFHELVSKTEEEKQLINQQREEKRKLKAKRKQIQEQNKRKNEAKKAELKQKSLEGMERKRKEMEAQHEEKALEVEGSEESDAEWYRREVGEEPDNGLFASQMGVKRKSVYGGEARKRQRMAMKSEEKFEGDNHSKITRFQGAGKGQQVKRFGNSPNEQSSKPIKKRQSGKVGSKVKNGKRY